VKVMFAVPPSRGLRRMVALFGDIGMARQAARKAFAGFARAGGRALYLGMGAAGLAWLDTYEGRMPEGASVGVFLDVSEVPGLLAGARPGLAVIDPANRPGAAQGCAHARRLGLALFEADAFLMASGGMALLVCESYGAPESVGSDRVRCLAQLRRFCGEFIEFGEFGGSGEGKGGAGRLARELFSRSPSSRSCWRARGNAP